MNCGAPLYSVFGFEGFYEERVRYERQYYGQIRGGLIAGLVVGVIVIIIGLKFTT